MNTSADVIPWRLEPENGAFEGAHRLLRMQQRLLSGQRRLFLALDLPGANLHDEVEHFLELDLQAHRTTKLVHCRASP